MSEIELRECPHCGGPVKLTQSKTLGDRLYVIECEQTSPCFGSGLGNCVIAAQKDQAIEAWNRRADDVERCFICDKPLKAGEMVLPDVNEGLGHRACFGEDRSAYVNDIETGEPLGPDDPIPSGFAYESG